MENKELDNNFLRRQVALLEEWLSGRTELTGLQRCWLISLEDEILLALGRDDKDKQEAQ